MIACGDARQNSHRLTLRTGTDQNRLVIRQPGEIIDLDHHPTGNREVAEVARHTHVAHHGAPHESHLATVQHSHIDDLLDSMHMRCERSHDDASLGAQENRVQHRDQISFAGHEAGDFGVGAV